MADRDRDAEPGEAPRDGARGEVGAGDLVALRREHLGDAAHAGAADADEVDALDLVLHRARAPSAMQASATRARRVRARDLARGDCAIASSDSRRAATARRAARRSRRELRLRNLQRRAGVDEKLRVGALLVGDRAGQRHDDRADADRGELGDGDRAAAADDEVGLGVARGHVVDEGDALGVDAGVARTRRAARRCAARPPGARRAAARPRGSSASAAGTRSFSACGAEAAADDEQAQRPAAAGEARLGRRQRGRSRRAADCRPIRPCAAWRPANASGKPSRMRSAPYASTRFARPGDRVRLVQHERLRRRRRPSARRETTRSRRSRARRRARGGG